MEGLELDCSDAVDFACGFDYAETESQTVQ